MASPPATVVVCEAVVLGCKTAVVGATNIGSAETNMDVGRALSVNVEVSVAASDDVAGAEEEISSVVVDSTVVGTNEFAVKVVKFMG